MTIMTPDGVQFDAIVFAEREPQKWMAGSDGFVRTQPFGGGSEIEADGRPVHVAIAYHADGRVVGYRNGMPYGNPYQSSGPAEYRAGQAVVGFGIRHLSAGGNKMLAGRVLRARLYDRALSSDEIRATFVSAPFFITRAQVLSALTASDRNRVANHEKRVVAIEAELAALGPIPDASDDKAAWADLARAIFSFKEFIYVQ